VQPKRLNHKDGSYLAHTTPSSRLHTVLPDSYHRIHHPGQSRAIRRHYSSRCTPYSHHDHLLRRLPLSLLNFCLVIRQPCSVLTLCQNPLDWPENQHLALSIPRRTEDRKHIPTAGAFVTILLATIFSPPPLPSHHRILRIRDLCATGGKLHANYRLLSRALVPTLRHSLPPPRPPRLSTHKRQSRSTSTS
jgi:hypothetical protein